jgi:hypothetical protein
MEEMRLLSKRRSLLRKSCNEFLFCINIIKINSFVKLVRNISLLPKVKGLATRKRSAVCGAVPVIQVNRILESCLGALAIEYHNENSLSRTTQACTCVICMACFDTFPSFCQEFIGISPSHIHSIFLILKVALEAACIYFC